MSAGLTVQETIDIEWANMPLYMGYSDIIQLGFKKTRVYNWFNRPDFPPMLRNDGKRVNKYKLKEWLEEREEKADETF